MNPTLSNKVAVANRHRSRVAQRTRAAAKRPTPTPSGRLEDWWQSPLDPSAWQPTGPIRVIRFCPDCGVSRAGLTCWSPPPAVRFVSRSATGRNKSPWPAASRNPVIPTPKKVAAHLVLYCLCVAGQGTAVAQRPTRWRTKWNATQTHVDDRTVSVGDKNNFPNVPRRLPHLHPCRPHRLQIFVPSFHLHHPMHHDPFELHSLSIFPYFLGHVFQERQGQSLPLFIYTELITD